MATEKVTLQTKGEHQANMQFDFEHAVRLLNYPNGSWQLPKNSPYRFKNGNLILKPVKGDSKSEI